MVRKYSGITNSNGKHSFRKTFLSVANQTMRKMNKLWDFCFNLLCIVGCFYQVQNVISSYLRFDSITRNKYYAPEVLQYPDLHYCFMHLEDFLNVSAINQKYGLKMNQSKIEDTYAMLDFITVNDILQNTPNADIEERIYRDITGNHIQLSRGKSCADFFDLKKYIVQQYVCYVVKAKNGSSLRFETVSKSLDVDRMIYEIKINASLRHFRKILPTITNMRFPMIENSYASAYYKRSDENIAIKLSCQNITMHWLGYPYDKFRFSSEREKDFYQCRDDCIQTDLLNRFDRLPFTSYYNSSFDKLNKKLFSHSMVGNQSTSKLMGEIFYRCANSCPIFACDYSYCLMIGNQDSSVALHGEDVSSSIRVESPGYPYFFITCVPQVPLLDSIIYVLSSLGTWFGLVIISCNPIKLFDIFLHKTGKQNFRDERRDLILQRMMARSRYYERYATLFPPSLLRRDQLSSDVIVPMRNRIEVSK